MAVCLFALTSCAANAGAESSANPAPQKTIEEPATLSLADLRQTYANGSSKSVNIDGVDLYFSDEGNGPTVLLLPPSFLNFRAWDGVAKTLTAANYRVIRFDFPSTGLSGVDQKTPVSGKIDFFERNAEIATKLLDHLGVESAHVVGTSSGGAAAFRVAANYPDRVNRLALVNSAGLPRTRQSDPNRDRAEERKWAAMKVKPREFWAGVLDRNFFEPDDAPEWLVTLAFDVNRRAEDGDPKLYAFRTGDPKTILSKVTAPTLIQWGTSNPTVVHLEAEVFQHWLTQAPSLIRKYDGLGHYPYLEDEALIAGDLLAFLKGEMDDRLLTTKRVRPGAPTQ
ncbi:MAG: alpha/beta hydrolase [Erythrobacter sp.]